MIIKTKDFQQILLKASGHLDLYFPQEIEINEDYYHSINKGLYNMTKEPEIAIGSLIDDWNSLELHFKDKSRPFTSVDLDRLAGILTAVSEKINPIQSGA